MQSLIDSSKKVKEWNCQQLAHHGLIKTLIEDALQNFRIPIKWSAFRDLPIEDDIKNLIYDVSPFVREEEGIETEGEEHKEESPRVSPEAPERIAARKLKPNSMYGQPLLGGHPV